MTLLLLAATANAATLTVGPSATYTTINAAISASASGDTILVQAGTYAENVDLRGRTVTLISEDGPAVTTISPTATVWINGGTLQGFTISPAAAIGVGIPNGSPTLRELQIMDPATSGLTIAGGAPVVEEVGIWNAGGNAIAISGGTPTLRRTLTWQAGNYSYAVNAASTLQNTIAIGGAWGYVFQTASSTATNIVALDARTGATAALYGSTITNGAFLDNTVLMQCFAGNTLTWSNGIAYNTTNVTGCSGSPTAAVTAADPGFTSWSSTASFYDIDLSPAAGSPMIDAGTGTDTDGSRADLGAFGGANGGWSDNDSDGVPVLFDCDDHDAYTSPGHVEREDDRDNDCDGVVDEDIPVDTGGDADTDTDTDSDTDSDTDTDTDTDADTDTDTDLNEDLDGDGFPASIDCDEHNLATWPGAPERTDGADNNCDGFVDEGTAQGDDDGDGYTELQGDCDDTRFDRYPGADDDWQADGIDNNCDGLPDDARGADIDNDGHEDNVDDCNDMDATSHVGAPDPTDGIDNDCDGDTDDTELLADADGDGVTPAAGDCDDHDAALHFGAAEIADDFIDQDCNGTDNYDVDKDGNAAPVSGGTDCDDLRSNVYPGAPEICGDNVDNNCDLTVDEACETDEPAPTTPDTCGCGNGGGPSGLALAGLAVGLLTARRRRGPG